MKILIAGLNYPPERIGIAPYTGDLAQWLAARGHGVEVVTAQPYYPAWHVPDEFRRLGYDSHDDAGVKVTRCPLYVPAKPSGTKRIIHHASFAVAMLPPLLARAQRRPDVVFAVAPSLMAAPVARLAARVAGAASWLHVQDFEVDAAISTGLVSGRVARAATRFERGASAGFDRYSSISPQMCARLVRQGIAPDRVFELRNAVDLDAITPAAVPSSFRKRWKITVPNVALYSGNLANKQGIDILVDAAMRLRNRSDILFVICGEGPARTRLEQRAAGLPNVMFRPLQPRKDLNDLLSLATIHLLPQLADAADLVLPSKMTNMLASGRAIVATAVAGTGIADELAGCGVLAPPGDADALAQAIRALSDDPPRREALGRAARSRALERWSRDAVMQRFEAALLDLIDARRRAQVESA